MLTVMNNSARDTLLETALRLFHQDGFHATGIDRILAESKVAKATLYKHFGSKEALMLDVLRLRDACFRQYLEERTSALAATPREAPLRLFDALAEWFAEDGFHGCLFINASAEFGSFGDPMHKAAAEHKTKVLDWLHRLCAKAGAADPYGLARQLCLLKEGAIVTAQVSRDPRAAQTAKIIAEGLLRANLPH
ncbi:MAG TPA: TetR family transcriptional regulator [Candidatus Sulfotelmatobacter sp.]|jgi:AcrR family transcriptional regulator|nr:TetR family transcriptional regulator [Candidatus Sulfotelmatobacter sp.]